MNDRIVIEIMNAALFLPAAICGVIAVIVLARRNRRLNAKNLELEARAGALSQQMEGKERQLALVRAELAELQSSASTMHHRIRHDILGHLNVISGFQELLEMGMQGRFEEKHQGFLRQMRNGVKSAVQSADKLIADEGPARTESTPLVDQHF